jgi:hypothetical protein
MQDGQIIDHGAHGLAGDDSHADDEFALTGATIAGTKP